MRQVTYENSNCLVTKVTTQLKLQKKKKKAQIKKKIKKNLKVSIIDLLWSIQQKVARGHLASIKESKGEGGGTAIYTTSSSSSG